MKENTSHAYIQRSVRHDYPKQRCYSSRQQRRDRAGPGFFFSISDIMWKITFHLIPMLQYRALTIRRLRGQQAITSSVPICMTAEPALPFQCAFILMLNMLRLALGKKSTRNQSVSARQFFDRVMIKTTTSATRFVSHVPLL